MSVPALRFKDDDGQDFPEWERKKLGEISTFFSGGTPLTTNKSFYNGNIAFIKSGEIGSNKTTQFITDAGLRGSSAKMVSVGDLLYALYGATSGEVAISKVNGAINQAVLCIRSKLNTYYLYSYLLQMKKSILETYLQGGQGNLSAEIIKSLDVPCPIGDEQIKIATFLKAVDEKVMQLTQKCEFLTQYKKGVMQQIFSQELRFKDDNAQDFPEWEECEFGKVYEFISTNSYSREMLTYEDGAIQNIHYGDIHTRYKSNFKLPHERVPYLSGEVDVSKIKDSQYCQNGDIVIADASEDYADVGKAIEIIEVGSKNLVAGLHTYLARNMNNKFALGFGGYLMQSSDVRSQIKVLATGVSVLSISKGNLAKVTIKLPCKAEQAKIASFLTAIDDKLIHTQNQLAAAKQYKQGLLQQMFV